MLLIALLTAFLVLIVLMLIWPRYASALSSLACLVGAALVLIYLNDSGLLWSPGQSPAPAPTHLTAPQR